MVVVLEQTYALKLKRRQEKKNIQNVGDGDGESHGTWAAYGEENKSEGSSPTPMIVTELARMTGVTKRRAMKEATVVLILNSVVTVFTTHPRSLRMKIRYVP